MKAIKNIEKKDLEIAFEGKTYVFEKGKTVLVEENVIEHLEGLVPLAFDFELKPGKKDVFKRVKTKTTPSLRPLSEGNQKDMVVTEAGKQRSTFEEADITPPSGTTDKDGVGWYGEGVQIEGTGSAFN